MALVSEADIERDLGDASAGEQQAPRLGHALLVAIGERAQADRGRLPKRRPAVVRDFDA